MYGNTTARLPGCLEALRRADNMVRPMMEPMACCLKMLPDGALSGMGEPEQGHMRSVRANRLL